MSTVVVVANVLPCNNKLRLLIVVFITTVFLAVTFYQSQEIKFSASKKIICGKFPKKSDIILDNEIWQVFHTSQGTFKLLNAYLDTKINKVKINCNGPSFNVTKIYCQYWHRGEDSPTVVVTREVQLLFPGLEFSRYNETR
jgi:hypothetical protein